MKLVTFITDENERVGALNGEYVIDIREARILKLLSKGLPVNKAIETAHREIPDSMTLFIEGGEKTITKAKESIEFAVNSDFVSAIHLLREVKLKPPIPRPPMILNMGNAYRPFPLGGFTIKPITSLIGPEEPIVIPQEISDFGAVLECEIGIVIGSKGRRIPRNDDAYKHVYGYTIYNDVTDYGKQIEGAFDSKLHDTFCPMGPYLVTKDEIEDPHNLMKRAWVNGLLAVERSTKEMIHKIPEFVSIPSNTLTLRPGSVISTGTPVVARIKHGDVVELEVTGLGRLRNPVIAEKN